MTFETTILDDALIDRLVAALDAQGAPVVHRLQPGLTDAEMDELTRPLGITLPSEARTWWGRHDGARQRTGDLHGSVSLGTVWWWAPLEAVVEDCEAMRRLEHQDGEGLWLDAWLPIVIGDGNLVIDTGVPAGTPTPVHSIDFECDVHIGSEHVPALPSLGALVEVWARALETDSVRYDPAAPGFVLDWDRADAVCLPTVVL